MRPLPLEVVLPGTGRAAVEPLPDGAPHDVREGMVRRRLVALGGPCPCGARMVGPNRAQRRAQRGRGLQVVAVVHELDCPASNDNLRRALAGWEASR